MKKRHIFSGSAAFRLYDFYSSGGQVNENVFAYSNRNWDERALVLYNNSYYETSGWIRQSSPAIPQEDGGLRQDTLTEALSIHGEDRYFSFFREQRSGLWFIRSSKELSERGLFVSLKGYEAQVFLDIHEREDGPGGPWSRRWSRLNHELNGRGTGDPDAAAADLFLGAVYRPFTEIFAPPRVRALQAAVESADSGALASLLKEFMTPVMDFIDAAVEYLDGADGNYEVFLYPGCPSPGRPLKTAETAAPHREDGNTAPASGPGEVKGNAKTTACAMARFSAFLERLTGITASPVAEALRPLCAAAGDAGSEAQGVPAPRELTAYALGYGALALLRGLFRPELPGKGAAALALLNHWQLDRKLRECFRVLGFKDDESWRIVEIMKALLGRSRAAADTGAAGAAAKPARAGKTKTGKTAKVKPEGTMAAIPENIGAAAAVLIAENYEADDFRRILGVNRFNDITWFNKEAFEESLFYLSCFLFTEDENSFGPAFAGGTERAALIAEFDRVMLKAEESSGYRLDELIKALSGI